jgi:predicted RNA binding protein YcfA (HicA-like mRNA interferase family)
MKLPRDLSGIRLARHLCRLWGYTLVHQVGSHIVLQTEMPSHHRIVISAHASLRVGTLNGILQSVSVHKGILREDLLKGL